MKKHKWIALIIFIIITASAYAAHLIHWDETPLEHSLFMLLLLPGLIAERPFMLLALSIFGDSDQYYNFWRTLMNFLPLIVGVFYALVYYFVVLGYKKFQQKMMHS